MTCIQRPEGDMKTFMKPFAHTFFPSRRAFTSMLSGLPLIRIPSRNFMHFTQRRFKTAAASSAKEVVVTAVPKASESRVDFKRRVEREVTEVVFNKENANHEVMLSYPTRVSEEHEKVVHAEKHTDLPMVDKPILAGHCMLAYLNEEGKASKEQTLSLRPDLSKASLYKADAAPDDRLPDSVVKHPVTVWNAKHTTAKEEIMHWADDAFYTRYVHKDRPAYPLRLFFRPISYKDQGRYFTVVNNVRTFRQRYSLLDHLHPYTGLLEGQVVTGENCTVILDVAEKMGFSNIKNLVGDNPTPQVVYDAIKMHHANLSNDNNFEKDKMSMPFKR
jgi:hypothetical protein